jgi:hypothetical protein
LQCLVTSLSLSSPWSLAYKNINKHATDVTVTCVVTWLHIMLSIQIMVLPWRCNM